MAIALVGTCVSAYSESVSKSVTIGNLVVFLFSGTDASTESLPVSSTIDTAATTAWTKVQYYESAASSSAVGIYWAKVTASGTLKVTHNTLNDPGCSLHEYSGANTTAPVDQTNNNRGDQTNPATVALTSVASGAVIVMIAAEETSPTAWTANGVYTERTEESGHSHTTVDYITPSADDYTPSTSQTSGPYSWIAAAASFLADVTSISVSASLSPSGSLSLSPSGSLSPSSSESKSVSPSVSKSVSPSISQSSSRSPSVSPSVSRSESKSVSPSISKSPSVSPSVSSSASRSISPSASVSSSASMSVSASISPSSSVSLSVSPSASPSVSVSVSPSISPSWSVSLSISPSVSPSLSESSSESPSISPSGAGLTEGSVCWGHITGVIEENIRTFADNWTGTGEIQNVGDAERIALNAEEYMVSEVVETGIRYVQLLQNNYAAGDNVTLKYRHGNTQVACEAAEWNDYTVPFQSLGYVQVRIEE